MPSPYIKDWLERANDNLWLKSLYLTEESFVRFNTLAEMAARMAAGSWPLGTAFYCGDICVMQQVDKHGEWLVIKGKTPFESLTVREPWERMAGMTKGKLLNCLKRIEKATEEQCKELNY